MNFNDTPIRRKLMLILMLSSLVAMLLTRGVFLSYERKALRQNLVHQLSTIAEILAANSTTALAFENEANAHRILASLQSMPHLTAAGLYDHNDRLFARYPAGVAPEMLPPVPGKAGHAYAATRLNVFQPVVHEGRRLGTLYVTLDTHPIVQAWLWGSLQAGLAVMAVILLVAYAFARALQKKISTPILALAQSARSVSTGNDYSVRAVKHGNDEIGALTEAFNQMLTRIQLQNLALQENETKLQTIIENLGEGLAVADPGGQLLHFNRPALALHGFSDLDEGRRHLSEFAAIFELSTLDGAVLPLDRWPLARVLRGEPLRDWEVRIRRLRSDWQRIFNYGGALVRDGNGRATMALITISDITDRIHATEALRNSERRFRALIEHSADCISVIDPDNRILYLSPAVAAVEGYTAEELAGENGITHTHPEDQPLVQETVRQLLAQPGKPIPVLWRRRHKDGRWLWLEGVATNLLHDPTVRGIVTNYRDVSARRLAGEEVLQLNRTLEQRVRERTAALETANEELGAFSYSVSHDLRAPLRHIHGYAEMLERDVKGILPEKAQRYLRVINEAAADMGRLIDDLLSFARMGRAKLHEDIVDLNVLVQQLCTAEEMMAPARRIVWQIALLPRVRADLAMIKVALVNLLGNAVKFTRTRDEARIEVGCAGREGGKLIFFVRDNGVGFDMTYHDKLFGVFQRLHSREEFEGTGIGLANVRRVIMRHGGRVWAQSTPNAGATFFFTLHPADVEPATIPSS